MNTNIKKWPLGSPVQFALESLFALMKEHKITADNVEKLVGQTPDNEAPIVSNSNMSDVNMQHLLAISLLDGKLNFNAAP